MGVFLHLLDQIICLKQCAHRKAGRRPKKAIKVTSDTVTVKMIMLRASVMVKEI
jgi:hypothetical protein